VVCPSVRLYVTLVHPAIAVGQNRLPFGRDTDVVRSNVFCFSYKFNLHNICINICIVIWCLVKGRIISYCRHSRYGSNVHVL